MSDQMNTAGRIGGVGATGPLTPATTKTSTDATKSTGEKSFADVMKDLFYQVDGMQKEADDMQNKLAAGQIQDTSAVFISTKKAELSFQTLMAVRNKIMDAYNELNQIRM